MVLFFACPALLCLAEPIVPSNPIDMATEVGSVADVRNKIVIIQKAMITKRTVTFTTDWESRVRLEYRLLSVNTENLQPIIAALTETLTDPDKDYKKPAAGFEITNTEVGGKANYKDPAGRGGAGFRGKGHRNGLGQREHASYVAEESTGNSRLDEEQGHRAPRKVTRSWHGFEQRRGNAACFGKSQER